MITAKVGRVGEGKSATASREIRYWLDKGLQVYTNLHLNEQRENYHYFQTQDWKVIFKLQDGIVVFDEGQFILDARMWTKTPVQFRQLLQKGRHEGLDFYILTQNIMQIDSMARRLIHEAKMVKKIFSSKKWNFGIYIEWSVDIYGLEKQRIDSIIPVAFYVMLKDDWAYYDSHALRSKKVPPPREDCEECGIFHQIGIGAEAMNTGDDSEEGENEGE